MHSKRLTIVLLFSLFLTQTFSQNSTQKSKTSPSEIFPHYKISVSTAYHSFLNFGSEETNTHHYEFHLKYKFSPKDKIGIKIASWKLFQSLGMPISDAFEMKETEFYSGRLKERGVGISYQRIIWKALFASVEILPLWKKYLDENNNKIDIGFKLYTSYHIGYHITMFKNRFYIEPQLHCNYWPIDSKSPHGFIEKDDKWSNNYILFEPNLYFGFKF